MVESVAIETAATVGGRVETVGETAEGAIAEVDVKGNGVVTKTVRRGATGISVRHAQNEATSKDCLEPQPWARRTTGRRRAQPAGMLLEGRNQVEPSKQLPEMVMRNPRVKGISLLPGVASPAR